MDPRKLEIVYYILASASIVWLPIRWLWKWFRRVDKAVTNHIPHIYRILQRMCDHMAIPYVDLEEDIREAHKNGHEGRSGEPKKPE